MTMLPGDILFDSGKDELKSNVLHNSVLIALIPLSHYSDGALPQLGPNLPACRFAERCPRVLPRCRLERPPLAFDATRHAAACWAPL